MTFNFFADGFKRLTVLATMGMLATASAAVAENNDEFGTTCDAESLTPKDFVECVCDKEGGIFWETDTEFGCWQLVPGEFDYRCLKGQPLSSCIVTLPASDPPDDEPENQSVPGAVSGGPGGGEATSVDPAGSGPSATDLETVQQESASDSFAPFGAATSDDQADGFRSDTESDLNADSSGAGDQGFESTDEESPADSSDDSFDEFDQSDDLAPEAASNPFEPQASIESQVAGPCGAGAASATVMLMAGLSLFGRLSLLSRDRCLRSSPTES